MWVVILKKNMTSHLRNWAVKIWCKIQSVDTTENLVERNFLGDNVAL
jgi:hypothetical protein